MPEVKEFLYRLQAIRSEMISIGPTEKESRILEDHVAYLEDLVRRGVVLLAGRTLNPGTGTFGIVVFRADSESAALGIMEGDPAVREGVMRAELHPFRVALFATQPPPEEP